MKLKLILISLIYGLVSCKEYKEIKITIYNDYNMYTFNQSTLDSIADSVTLNSINKLDLDFYPLSDGPYNTSPMNNGKYSNEDAWDLTNLMESTNLEVLHISSLCNYKTSLTKNIKLKQLTLNTGVCNDIKLDVNFSKMPDLEELSLSSHRLDKKDVSSLMNLKNLKYLGLNHCEAQMEELDFSILTELETLSINNSTPQKVRLNNIGTLKNIQNLTFNNCEVDLKDLIGLKDQLKFMNLTGSTVHNWHLLGEFQQLEVLYIGNISNIIMRDYKNVQLLGKLKNLRELSIKRNTVNNLDFIKNLKKLKSLYIQKTHVTEIPHEVKNNKKLEIFR